ncbi:MAG: threonine synthase [Magnetococcales bacterium]|nr:threonine synthase [Magnetococcales bacterium]MBF0152058.1 threonine synthase [Magnetococcales bacterium]MBF0172304.1 threonine synthase [Magnetococcales bacterium]MBF0349213.1 threonine synthase [Magnetococcales bacterium]MBF0630680.1 threonine synthase [Magnetococcales bacterium]
MKYLSTRGGIQPIPFSQAVMMGLATDGGLTLPVSIPTVTTATLKHWADLEFIPLALEIISLFVAEDDIPRHDLDRLIHKAFASFTHPEITPLVTVGNHHVLELFHGPTLAFKDVALQLLGNLFEYLLQRDGGTLNILGATSGDTGSAAIHGVRGKKGMEIFILHPHRRVSPIQERQMTTVLDANVHNIAIEGTFDDGQAIVKKLFNDLAFKKKYHLGAVNSINWARIVAQVVYYFYAWGRLAHGDATRPVEFSVPTGNFGDIFAGYIAKRMGLPMGKLLLATNRNDILTRFFSTGSYRIGQAHPTISPSMDIQVSSNFERYLYYLLHEDPVAVGQKMAELDATGAFQVPRSVIDAAGEFRATAVGEEETVTTIRSVHQRYGYLLDPHTAVGFAAAKETPGMVCLATAHPAKFGDAVKQAIGREPQRPPLLDGLEQRPYRCQVMAASVQAVRDFIAGQLG